MCFQLTEFHQIVTKEDKRFQIETSMIIKIVNMTSKILKSPRKIDQVKPESAVNRITNKKSKLKGGSMHQSDEINDEYVDEILHSKKLLY